MQMSGMFFLLAHTGWLLAYMFIFHCDCNKEKTKMKIKHSSLLFFALIFDLQPRNSSLKDYSKWKITQE